MSIIAGSEGTERIFRGQRKDFIVMRKDSFNYTDDYTYINDEGIETAYDFTGCIGKMDIKKKKNDKTPIKVIAVNFDSTVVNRYSLNLDYKSMDMDAGKYYYDMQIYDANGLMVTKLYGNFIVLQDVTDFEGVIEEEYSGLFISSIGIEKEPGVSYSITFSDNIGFETFKHQYFENSVLFKIVSSVWKQLSHYYNVMFSGSVSITTTAADINYSVLFKSQISISTN